MEHVYEDCPELHRVDALIENHYLKGDYKTCFRGCMKLALKGYALAECQVGWFYLKGEGVEQNLEKALYWTKRALHHGDPDAPENLEEIQRLLKSKSIS